MKLFLILLNYAFLIWMMFEVASVKKELNRHKFNMKIQRLYVLRTQKIIQELIMYSTELGKQIEYINYVFKPVEEIKDKVLDRKRYYSGGK